MDNKKNIWIINHYAFPYGYGFHTRQHTIALLLKKLGHNVTIFASSFNHLKTKNVEFENIFKEETIDGLKYVWIKTPVYKGNGLGRILNLFEFSKNLNKIYKKIDESPEIVWVSSPQPFSIYNGLKLKQYFKAKFVFDERDIWPLTLQVINNINKYHPLMLIFRYLQLQAYKQSDVIVTPLDNLKEFVELSGHNKNKVKIIPQPFIEFSMEKFDIALPEEGFIVGYVGSIGESNSIFNLIKAARLLIDQLDIYFVIVGDGPQFEEMKSYAKEHDINNLTFTGKLPKEKAMYILSKCHLLYKGNPDLELYKYGIASVKLMEYIWFNKPIIHATNINDDLVTLSNTGIKIKSDDEQKLSQTILNFKFDSNMYNKYTNNGKEFIENNYNENQIISKLKNIMDLL